MHATLKAACAMAGRLLAAQATARVTFADAAIGANVGGGGGVVTLEVQRCAMVDSRGRPEYWDVTYHFRGREHRVQMTAPPGRTVLVNEFGEPRS